MGSHANQYNNSKDNDILSNNSKHNDTQQGGTHYNDSHHNNAAVSVIMLSLAFLLLCYADCR